MLEYQHKQANHVYHLWPIYNHSTGKILVYTYGPLKSQYNIYNIVYIYTVHEIIKSNGSIKVCHSKWKQMQKLYSIVQSSKRYPFNLEERNALIIMSKFVIFI